MVHASSKRPAPSTVSVRRLLFCVAAAGSASLEGVAAQFQFEIPQEMFQQMGGGGYQV